MSSHVMAVGDLASTEKGSGARANGGKPDMSLLPLLVVGENLVAVMRNGDTRHSYAECIRHLGLFQATHTPEHLQDALNTLGGHYNLADCARVFEYGKKKYAAWNWAKGMPWSIPLACAVRHLLAAIEGEQVDPESGELHVGHVYCNIFMLQTYIQTYPEGCDLPPPGLLG